MDIAAPSCKNLECLRDTRLLISSHTHACTHARVRTHTYNTHATHTHMHTHTTDTCITCVGLVEQEETTTNQYEEEKRWVFSFDLKEESEDKYHTMSIAFWHLPPNSARFSYATEGAAVQQCGRRPPEGSGTNMTVEAT